MRYIVGYAPNNRGTDAVGLASVLGWTQGAELCVVHVLDGPAPDDAELPEERTVQEIRAGRAQEWLSQAVADVPAGVPVTTRVVYADSVAEGLIGAARESAAELIIVSAARYGPLKRFTIGSVANALLHSSPLPVALVPSGYDRPSEITRMTAAVGSRQGADTLLDVATGSAARRQVPLRLVSLIALDYDDGRADERAVKAARSHAEQVLDEAVTRVQGRTEVTATVAEGATVEQAVESVSWDDGEIALVGSSRLAEHRKIFMGSTANKILRVIPIPLVVVPRAMEDADPDQ